jgi:cobalt-precorrin-5B (C1)-methyltransferase
MKKATITMKKKGRTGYTTGACAAAAAKAAAHFLAGGEVLRKTEITLPEGRRVTLALEYVRPAGKGSQAAARKEAGNDPDITHSALVVVGLSPLPGREIIFAAGEGVGTVTKPGLSVAPGEPAINPVPRQMITSAIREVTPQGMLVTVSIPEGRKLAGRTFNPRLGITGGLSVLGTSGIVRPFNIASLRASLTCALDVAAACGIKAPVFVPGNIGRRSAVKNFRIKDEQVIEAGNEWSFIIDAAAGYDFSELLIVGHPGKLAKLAAGNWDTHSARSESALSSVAILAEEMFGGPFSSHVTAEGIFASLVPPEAHKLGNSLAGTIRDAVMERTEGRFKIALALTDMQCRIIGTSGDLTSWK